MLIFVVRKSYKLPLLQCIVNHFSHFITRSKCIQLSFVNFCYPFGLSVHTKYLYKTAVPIVRLQLEDKQLICGHKNSCPSLLIRRKQTRGRLFERFISVLCGMKTLRVSGLFCLMVFYPSPLLFS